MATPRKDLRRQSLSVQRVQHRDRLFRASTSLALEMQKQDLKFRWVQRRLHPSPTLSSGTQIPTDCPEML